jgi:hypothetical protein
MKKIILSILSLASICITNAQNTADRIIAPQSGFTQTGSVLCDNFKQIFTLPDSLYSAYRFETEVTSNPETKELTIVYKAIKDFNKKLTFSLETDLSSYISFDGKGPIERLLNINSIVQVDQNKADTNVQIGVDPFTPCYEVKSNCDSVTVTEKMIGQEWSCPGRPGINIGLQGEIQNDSILILKQNYMVLQNPLCYFVKYIISTDSISFKNPKNIVYKIYENFKEHKIICTADIPISGCDTIDTINHYTKIGEANLTACIPTSINESNTKILYAHPNPASNQITIDGLSGKINLINTQGQSTEISGNQDFQLDNIKSGLYILQFELDGKFVQEKILIE